ncbi:MAG: flagellar assembly protein FliW [Nannocystaceae bacterium]
MPLGIPGFPGAREFILLDHRPGSMFRWLQSVDTADLAFVVIDPLLADPDYPVDLVRRSLGFLALDASEELVVLAICTVPPAPEVPTVNLLAPVGVGLSSRRGAQVVLHETAYNARQQFLPKAQTPAK